MSCVACKLLHRITCYKACKEDILTLALGIGQDDKKDQVMPHCLVVNLDQCPASGCHPKAWLPLSCPEHLTSTANSPRRNVTCKCLLSWISHHLHNHKSGCQVSYFDNECPSSTWYLMFAARASRRCPCQCHECNINWIQADHVFCKCNSYCRVHTEYTCMHWYIGTHRGIRPDAYSPSLALAWPILHAMQ